MRKARQYRSGYEFSDLKKLAQELRAKQTSAEALLWELLRSHRLLGVKLAGGQTSDLAIFNPAAKLYPPLPATDLDNRGCNAAHATLSVAPRSRQQALPPARGCVAQSSPASLCSPNRYD